MPNSTIIDIAKQAKVSPSAVSLAFHPEKGASRLRPATRERILKIAKELNYHTDLKARGLKNQRTYHIGFLVETTVPDPATVAWSLLLSSLQGKLWEHGYRLGFYFFKLVEEWGFEDFLTPNRFVDGIVTIGRNLTPTQIKKIRASGIRAISLFHKINGFFSLMFDEWGAGRAAADYLYACGHRQSAVLAHRYADKRWNGRIDGFLERAAEIGLEVPPSAQFYTDALGLSGTAHEIGQQLFRKFLKIRPPIRCIYCPSDHFAFGILAAMDEHGLREGKDLSILSYDNLEGIGAQPWSSPRLTSFAPSKAAIGNMAAEILVGSRKEEKPGVFTFMPRLVIRDSVKREATASEGKKTSTNKRKDAS